MASTELEYESDPEEAKQLLAMRRREASDDEEVDERESEKRRVDRRAGMNSDESNSQGGAADYYDEDLYEEDDAFEDVEEEDEEVLGVKQEEDGDGGVVGLESGVKESCSDGRVPELEKQTQGENKEPFAVPTAGAFYMHDDRFRGNAGGGNRRIFGGRKLWESRDGRKWGHDKFDEITVQERNYEDRRSSKGNYRARDKSGGSDRWYVGGQRSKTFNNQNNMNNNQNQPPKSVRGRGPRRYEPANSNNRMEYPLRNKRSGKPFEKSSHSSSTRALMPMSNTESNPAPAEKHMFASGLNYASPPFYPSTSSNKDSSFTQKRNAQSGNVNRNLRQSVMDENFPTPQSDVIRRGKSTSLSDGMDKLHIDDSVSPATGKTVANLQRPSGFSAINTAQSTGSKFQGRAAVSQGRWKYETIPSNAHVDRSSLPQQFHAVQRGRVELRVQPSAQHPVTGSQASSPPRTAVALHSYEPGVGKSTIESNKSKSALIVKGECTTQGTGRGSFLYRGTQMMGTTDNLDGGPSDQNFPTFLPVMQFGSQHTGGGGVPAVGMAFPGYVGQPQLGLGNSDLTWLPVLAGAAGAFRAAGAMGATYCSPYMAGAAGALGAAYHPHSPGKMASTNSSSKDNSTTNRCNELKSSQGPVFESNEFERRQNNPRRYSEMNFGE